MLNFKKRSKVLIGLAVVLALALGITLAVDNVASGTPGIEAPTISETPDLATQS